MSDERDKQIQDKMATIFGENGLDKLSQIESLLKMLQTILKDVNPHLDKISKEMDRLDQSMEAQNNIIRAQNKLLLILHHRVERMEAHFNATEEQVLSGDLPKVGFTDEETEELQELLGVLVVSMNGVNDRQV